MQTSSQWRHIYIKGKQLKTSLRKQFDKNLLSSNPKYDKKKCWGSWGPLCRTQGYQILRAVRPHHRADKCIRENNNHQFFIYMGLNVIFWGIFSYSGGPGWPINNQTGPILFRSYPLTYINLHLYQYTYKIWKQSDKDFLSYHENDEVSADADADTA